MNNIRETFNKISDFRFETARRLYFKCLNDTGFKSNEDRAEYSVHLTDCLIHALLKGEENECMKWINFNKKLPNHGEYIILNMSSNYDFDTAYGIFISDKNIDEKFLDKNCIDKYDDSFIEIFNSFKNGEYKYIVHIPNASEGCSLTLTDDELASIENDKSFYWATYPKFQTEE